MPVIDCYGNESTSRFFQNAEKKPFEVVQIGTKKYIRFDNSENCAIMCVDETNADDLKIAWTYGAWSNKENLSYDHSLNETIEI